MKNQGSEGVQGRGGSNLANFPEIISVYDFFCPLPILRKKKEPKPKLFCLDIFGWGAGLPRERVGAKKLGMSLETQGNQTFRRDIPGFLPGYPGGARKV